MPAKRKRRSNKKIVLNVMRPVITITLISCLIAFILINEEVIHFAGYDEKIDFLLLGIIAALLVTLVILFLIKK